ncbi:MAG TPA: uracil-DNA glycosylase [Candidatus Saccharimonadales bacterium]
MTKQQRLDEIKQKIVEDNVCPELRETATNMVFGEGNPNADIVFVGEAPGKKEDETGRPFVGASGKFLEEMLNSIGLERKDVYITSILKYRPPNNRDPFPKEKHDFLPYLQAQLEVIEPKVLVTLGRHSTNCFLPDLQISQAHGQPKRIRVRASDGKGENAWVILPLYHPAAALYQAAMRQTLIDDFSKIPNLMKKLQTS